MMLQAPNQIDVNIISSLGRWRYGLCREDEWIHVTGGPQHETVELRVPISTCPVLLSKVLGIRPTYLPIGLSNVILQRDQLLPLWDSELEHARKRIAEIFAMSTPGITPEGEQLLFGSQLADQDWFASQLLIDQGEMNIVALRMRYGYLIGEASEEEVELEPMAPYNYWGLVMETLLNT